MFDYKQLTDDELHDIFRDIDFKLEPMRHQYITMAHALGNDITRAALFHDIGTGKTLTAIWLSMLWKTKKTLVVCPISAFRGWNRDLGKHTNLSYKILEGEKAKRIEHLEQDYDFYVINYEGLKSIYAILQADDTKPIELFNNNYLFLSNFSQNPVIWNDIKYPTVENAFQAAKSTDPEVMEQIRKAESPAVAKQLGRKVRLSFRSDWEKVRVDVMAEIVELKFLQNIDLIKKLIATEKAYLREGNYWHDNFWGNCTCTKCKNIKGENVLGEILMKVRKAVGGEGKVGKSWIVDHVSFVDNFDNIIFDEVHKCTSLDAIQSKLCYKLSQKSKYVIGMTGTPIRSNLMNLWNIIKVIDLGDHLGLNFFKFREKYFKKSRFDYVPYKDSEEKILKRILPIATSFKREECLDLPDKMYEIYEVEATSKQRKAMNDIIKGLQIEIEGGTLNPGNVLTKSQYLKEVAGGFLYTKDDDKKKKTYNFPVNPKLQAVEDIVELTDSKIIIFHQYEEEGRLLERWAKKKKIGYASMRGEIKDTNAEFDRWLEEDSCKLLFAHPRTASESLDMTIAWLEIFYSTGGFIEREQAEGRIRRKHQTKKQLYIDIVMRDSPDEVSLERLGERKSLSERVLEFIRNYGKKGIDDLHRKATLFD